MNEFLKEWAEKEDEEKLIQIVSFFYDTMSMLSFLENKKYHLNYLYFISPFFLFITRSKSEESFVFTIKHENLIKFLVLPEVLLEYFYNKLEIGILNNAAHMYIFLFYKNILKTLKNK